jgi:hypothetical protein
MPNGLRRRLLAAARVPGAACAQAVPDRVVTDDGNLIQQASGGTAWVGVESILLARHALDPPDPQDVLRRDVIQSVQGKRNPFIDDPEWVEIAFAQPRGSRPQDGDFDALADFRRFAKAGTTGSHAPGIIAGRWTSCSPSAPVPTRPQPRGSRVRWWTRGWRPA